MARTKVTVGRRERERERSRLVVGDVKGMGVRVDWLLGGRVRVVWRE